MVELAEVERLHWDEGLTPRQIATRMGMAMGRTYELLHACPRGWRKQTPGTQPQAQARPDITAELVVEMYWGQGMTLPQIAAELGCAPSTVHKRLQRSGRGARPVGKNRGQGAVPLASTEDDGGADGDDVQAGRAGQDAGPAGAG